MVVLLEEEPEGELETEISSVEDEDELSLLSLELSSVFAIQEESNTAMLNSRTNKLKKTLILFLSRCNEVYFD